MKRIPALLVSVALAATAVQPALARTAPARPSVTSISPVEVSQAVHHDVSRPLRDLAAAAGAAQPGVQHVQPWRRFSAPSAAADAALQNVVDPAVQTTIEPRVSATVGLNFEGVSSAAPNPCNCAPPDTEGVVGATQYVQLVNTAYDVFAKATGTKILGPVAANTLWSGFGGGCQTNNDGDPIAQYDKAANRWVLTQFSVSTTPFLECVAVSTSSDATGTYNRYAFSYGNVQFNDYPKLGVWPDAYYISYNIFNNGQTFAGAKACAFDRTAMLAGNNATQQCFQGNPTTTPNGLLPSDLDGSTPPPAGEPNYFLGLNTPGTAISGNTLNLWKFHVDFANPANSTFTGPTAIHVFGYTLGCGSSGTCVPQLGTSQRLDSLGDRLMYRLAYRNFGSAAVLVLNHSVQVSSTQLGIRWYEIAIRNQSPTVFGIGTVAPDTTTSRWMGSIAMDKVGDVLLGYSASSSSIHPAIRFTGRMVSDPANTMESEATLFQGNGSETTGLSRWGDYSAMTVDPVDDCTMWYTQEYEPRNGTFNWHTRIFTLKFPNCH
jgi:hypothetical protein